MLKACAHLFLLVEILKEWSSDVSKRDACSLLAG
jgi:hypothetical protein